MMSSMRRCSILGIGAALLALPACGTEEFAPRPLAIAAGTPSTDNGYFMVFFTPPDATFEQWQARIASHANLTPYHVFMDGKQLAYQAADGAQPFVVSEGISGVGYYAAGAHHFEVAAAGGGPTIFVGDGAFSPGSTARLYIFGERAPLQGRVVSYPAVPAPGTVHASLINLVRSGQSLELVSCMGADPCASLSPPLAYGETFDAAFPASSSGETRYQLASGATLGWRQIATAAVPAPPVQPLLAAFTFEPYDLTMPPPNLAAAPVFLSPEGQVLLSF
jgi:hypothetical protein